ncbi:MAG: hypothetical protein ACKOC5_04145 [Chloroflexota bacterium]
MSSSRSGALKLPQVTTERLVAALVFLAIFAMASKPSMDTDTWWHLRTGQWILEHGAVPRVDLFSYTRLGQPWLIPGWLVQAPMAWLYRALGPGGLNLWTAAMVTLAFVFIWRTLPGGVFLKAFVVVLAAAVSGVYWAARPYLVTFVLAALFLRLLEAERWAAPDQAERAGRRLLWLPALMVIWANAHGGFAVGFILLGVYGLDRLARLVTGRLLGQRWPAGELRRLMWLALSGLLMLGAVCLTPAGPQMLLYPFKTVAIEALQAYILEWQSPNFHLPAAQPLLLMLAALIAALGASRQRMALSDFLLAAGFTCLALLAWRNVALFALAAPLVIARHAAPVLAEAGVRVGFSGASRTAGPRQARLNLALLVVFVLAVLVKAGSDFLPETNRKAMQPLVPVEAAAFIRREQPAGRLFNSYNWGAYLLWELPEYPVFIDGRTDLYNDAIIGEWLQVVRGEPGWQDTLDRWGVRLVLLEPSMPVTGLLEGHGWRLLYRDDQALVYAR